MSLYIGIDPGASGGIAILGAGSPIAYAMPATERDTADILSVYERDGLEGFAFAAIENVHSMPRQGVASSFKFGRSYGFLRGLLIAYGIPFTEVTPAVWQRAMKCLTHGDKNISKARAQQLFPQIKVTHAVADALLIATYCRDGKGRG